MAQRIINQKELNEKIDNLSRKDIEFEIILFDGNEESQINNMIQSDILAKDLIQIGQM